VATAIDRQLRRRARTTRILTPASFPSGLGRLWYRAALLPARRPAIAQRDKVPLSPAARLWAESSGLLSGPRPFLGPGSDQCVWLVLLLCLLGFLGWPVLAWFFPWR
jgi:hypothetical protein